MPYEVDLGEPLGARSLADGQCRDGSGAISAMCRSEGAVRYEP